MLSETFCISILLQFAYLVIGISPTQINRIMESGKVFEKMDWKSVEFDAIRTLYLSCLALVSCLESA